MNSKFSNSIERSLKSKERFEETIAAHNAQLSEIKGRQTQSNIRVNIRIRPLNAKELEVVQFKTAYGFGHTTALYLPVFQVVTDEGLEVHAFQFDGNHGQHVDQVTLFHSSCGHLINTLTDDGISAIFAYGQTGSGKTFTMSGIAAQLADYLPYDTHTISITILEVYGDIVRDLDSNKLLKVVIDSEGDPKLIGGQTFISVNNKEDCLQAIEKGFESRKTVATNKNDTSSRSHFICNISMVDKTSGLVSDVRLIDLAGSERVNDTKHHDSERIKESALINSSLMALKECIRARSSKSDKTRIPFRSSKLTTLLKDVLIPSEKRPSNLVMMATLAPTIHDVSHSLDTFRYAAALKYQDDPLDKIKFKTATTSPMAWSQAKLDTWLLSHSNQQINLDMIVQDDLNPLNFFPGEFKPPPWKHIYDMPESKWNERCAKAEYDVALLRTQYRTLFVQKRSVVKSINLEPSYDIQVLPLLETKEVGEVRDPKAVEAEKLAIKSAKEKAVKDRQAKVMAKLLAKGAAARNQYVGK
ncbi:P-loop containing nucleoside triphosphate hydrolase protein [Globomyces pollinis-pini]|nr:P-loop containing nucleoside triphosphate hydrolase protein [Globomyces pollinis-pini]